MQFVVRQSHHLERTTAAVDAAAAVDELEPVVVAGLLIEVE